jgi:uncharacterized protein (TIGR00369 family)
MTTQVPEGFEPVLQEQTFIAHIGGIHRRQTDERVETCLVVKKHHTNPNGVVHGGVVMTMLDITLGMNAQAAVGRESGRHPITIQLSCSLVAGAREGELLRGEARVEASTRSLCFVSGRVHVDGRTVSSASAVFRIPSPPA